uniref:Uncharacterized protein n=1 Tax=Vannella robusta TaxID=1487602 RepID=A0A7S4IIV5_9EUKA|mmetsp:Transcript_3057/g.3763  ORF Transcript_3057/g.3763 Transcript_3057/m.3763 type:complete len:241 (+) Transcript_3057:11-733(+)
MGFVGGLLWAISRACITPSVRYELQLRITAGQTGVTIKEIAKSPERFQGLLLEVLQLLPPVVVRWCFKGFVTKMMNKLPQGLLLEQTMTDLPLVWLSQLAVHPLSSMNQLQATLNRETGVIEAWDCLNRTPRFMFQGLMAGILYSGLARVLWYVLRKYTPIPTDFIPHLIASWVFYPLLTIRGYQMEAAMFSESQSMLQSANTIYTTGGITGFWAGSMIHCCNQSIPLLVLLTVRRFINV